MKKCDEKQCSPGTCHIPDIKYIYDTEIEKFESRKEHFNPDKLKKFISKRKKYFLSELDWIRPNINDNQNRYKQNAYCLNSCLNWLLDFYKVEEEKLTPTGKVAQSFTWTGSPAQLEELRQALMNDGYIDQGTTKEAFTAIFADELNQCKPIQWRCSNRLISYLFDQMYMQGYIVKEWQSIIEKCQLFKSRTGKTLKAGDLASALSEINDQNKGLNPKGSDKIDTILKNLKTLRP
jgi:hypothetical protein